MCKLMLGLIKLTFLLAVIVLVAYLLTLPPERRGGKLREVGMETLDGIENLAGMGRDALSEDVTEADSSADLHDGDFASSHDQKGIRPLVLPSDFRRELAEAVRRLNVVTITERWQAIEHSVLTNRSDVSSRIELVHEAASLALLFRHKTWHVAGRTVPSDQLELFLADYSNP